MARTYEVLWVIEHQRDLEADFLRFYRIDDISELDGPRFFSLAYRVVAYGGVMSVRASEEQQQGNRNGKGKGQDRKVIPSERGTLNHVLGDYIETTTAG